MSGAKPYNVIQGHPIPPGSDSGQKMVEEVALLRAEVAALREALAELAGLVKGLGTAAA
jgi:hypothetical protein